MLGLVLSLALGIGTEVTAAPVAGNDATSATQPAVNDDAPGKEMRVQVGKATWVFLYQSMNADGTLVQVEGCNASTAAAESAALKFFRADRLKTNREGLVLSGNFVLHLGGPAIQNSEAGNGMLELGERTIKVKGPSHKFVLKKEGKLEMGR